MRRPKPIWPQSKKPLTAQDIKLLNNIKIKVFITLKCPNRGHKKEEQMPTDAYQFFYECTSCKKMLRSKDDDCFV
ncbi:GDCCVxC domain-containing (seleno)protein [Arenibacter troitsensis]|uniref:GDCCVxC domain-containing (seleno)protein n=1 Tax=Arenibacter troitsensis TaxID=188872 RepID=UPI0029372D50|nr:GDCCVxC domain-containing (seleno)protein [Arenibacter troitsensis]